MNADVNKKHRVALMRCTVLFSYGRAGRIAGVTLLGLRRETLRYDGIRHITKREKRVLVIPTNSSRINYEDVAKKQKRGKLYFVSNAEMCRHGKNWYFP